MSDDITQLFGGSGVTRRASVEEISAVEADIGVLPPSYKAFAETFGFGKTNGLFVIEIPFNMSGSDGLLVLGRVLHDQVHWLANRLREDGCEVGAPDCLEPYDDASRDIVSFFEDLYF